MLEIMVPLFIFLIIPISLFFIFKPRPFWHSYGEYILILKSIGFKMFDPVFLDSPIEIVNIDRKSDYIKMHRNGVHLGIYRAGGSGIIMFHIDEPSIKLIDGTYASYRIKTYKIEHLYKYFEQEIRDAKLGKLL